MFASVSAELLKLVKRPATWTVVALWLVLNMTFGYLLPYISYASGDRIGPNAAAGLDAMLPANMVPNVLGGYPMFGGAMIMILGALMTGSEYGWGTLKTVLTQGPGRLQVYAGKLIGLVVTVTVLTLASLGLSAAFSSIIAGVESQPVEWPAFTTLAEGYGAGWLILLMWALLGALLGLAMRGTALSIGLGLIWALVIENLIRGVSGLLSAFEEFYKLLPGANAGSLVATFGEGTAPGVVDVVSGTRGLVTLLVLVAAFTLIGAVLMRRRDIT